MAEHGELQFQKAEFVPAQPEFRCISCRSEIADSYYQVAGAVTCPACAEQRRTFQGRPEGRGMFLKALMYGLGAAVAGSIIYAVVSLTGFQFSIVAIVVGVMVGKAIHHVTNRRSSLRYQVLAVFLTYAGITGSYIPSMISAAKTSIQKKQVSTATQATPATPAVKKVFNPVRLVGALALLAAFTLIIPFFALFHSPASGLLNLFIIGIGLMQAWRITKPDRALIMGPYSSAERNAG